MSEAPGQSQPVATSTACGQAKRSGTAQTPAAQGAVPGAQRPTAALTPPATRSALAAQPRAKRGTQTSHDRTAQHGTSQRTSPLGWAPAALARRSARRASAAPRAHSLLPGSRAAAAAATAAETVAAAQRHESRQSPAAGGANQAPDEPCCLTGQRRLHPRLLQHDVKGNTPGSKHS